MFKFSTLVNSHPLRACTKAASIGHQLQKYHLRPLLRDKINARYKEVLVGALLDFDPALGFPQVVTIDEVTKLKTPHIAVNIENVETKTAAIACGIGLSLNMGVR